MTIAHLFQDTPRWKLILWSVAGLCVLKVIVVVGIFMSLLDRLPLPFLFDKAEPSFLLIQVILAVFVPQAVFSLARLKTPVKA